MSARHILLFFPFVFLCISAKAQEPFTLKPLPEQSLEWIHEIETAADFEFSDRTTAAGTASRILERGKNDKKNELQAKRILYLNAKYENRDEEAKSLLQQLTSISPDDKEYTLLQLSKDVITSPEMAKTKLDQFEEFQKKFPKYPPAIVAKCELLQALSREKEALDLTNEALKDSPRDALLHATKASLLLRLGKADEAIISSDTALMCVPAVGHTVSVYILRANILYQLERYQEAIQMAAIANRELYRTGKHRNIAKILLFVSNCYEAKGNYEMRYITAKAATKIQSDSYESWAILADACARTGRVLEGHMATEEYGKLLPNTAEYYRLKILLHLVREENLEAQKISDNAAKRYPENTQIQFYHIYSLLVSNIDGGLASAKQKIANAIEKGWRNPPTWHYLEAIAHTRAKDFAKADEALKLARQKNKDSDYERTLIEGQKDVAEKREIRFPFAQEKMDDSIHSDLILTLESAADLDFVPKKVIEEQCKEKLEDPKVDLANKLKAAGVYLHHLEQTNQIDEANKFVDLMAKVLPSNQHVKREQSRIHHINSSFAEQAKSWEVFCKEYPSDKQGMGLWVVSLCKIESYERASEISDKLLSLSPNHPRGLQAKALVAQHKGQFEKALGYANQWICQTDQLQPIAVYLVRAEILISLNRSEDALADLALAKHLTEDPQLLKNIRKLAAQAFKQQKKETLAKQVLLEN